MFVFDERRNPEYPKKNPSEQRREPTTNSTHMICHRRRDLSEPGPRELLGGECSHHATPLDTMIWQPRLLGWILHYRCFDHETFFTILLTWLANPKKGIRMFLEPVRWHPRRPRAGEKARRKFSSTGGRAPGYRLSRDYFQTVKRLLAPDWAQKMLCIIVPNRGTSH